LPRNEDTRFRQLQNRLKEALKRETEALDQQTATAEILRVISSPSPNLQLVLDALAEKAARVCKAVDAAIFRRDDQRLLLVAHHGAIPTGRTGEFTLPLVRGSYGARSVLEGRVIHVADGQTEVDFPEGSRIARELGFRTTLHVPLIRDGVAIGTISLRRIQAQLFTDRQVALLQTFADQAVIAIENVRLFTELQEKNRALTQAHAQVTEALEQQTATAEILRVISSSPTDIQPVLEALAESAARLCGSVDASIYRRDGDRLFLVAQVGPIPQGVTGEFFLPLGRGTVVGRSVLDGRTVHVLDLQAMGDEFPEGREHAWRLGLATVLAVPLMRAGVGIGSISLRRTEAQLFTLRQAALLETFANQAVIAIENVRLFTELQARTGELTQSVEQLTALGEVSQALSSTLDLDTVLTTVVNRAVELAGADGGSIFEYDENGEEFQPRVSTEAEGVVAATRQTHLRKGEGAVGRMAVTRETVQIPDIAIEGAYDSHARGALLSSGRHALLAVPLLSEQHIVGGLVISRNAAGAFPVEVVELLKTFGTQSALAIQNARLFREIADKSQQLEAASQHKSEFLANMSHELRTPLNAIIGFSEVLAQGMFGEINEKQTEYLEDILESGRHLLSLINDILDLSKIEAGRMELEPADFDLPSAIENALTLVRERASRRGIRLGSTIDKLLGMITGDERKVKQVLLNLLSNALKFTPEGGQIDVAARLHDDRAEVSVSDTGIGIAPTDQDRVFEEFRQVGTADKKAEGTGLGLTLSRKFVELHGGKIWVQSEVGCGSTFTFTLPVSPWLAS
jgi:signal transduction histidine kinase